MDYRNTKTTEGSATPLLLAFPREGNLNFPWEKSHWANTVVEVHQIVSTKTVDFVTSMILAAPSAIARGQLYRPEDGLNKYSLLIWYSRLKPAM